MINRKNIQNYYFNSEKMVCQKKDKFNKLIYVYCCMACVFV